MTEPVHADVLAFLLKAAGSFDALELLLRHARTRPWSDEDVARELGLPASVVEAAVLELRSKKPRAPADADPPLSSDDDQRLRMMGLLCSAAIAHVRETTELLQRLLRVADVNELALDERIVDEASRADGFLERAARQGLKLVDVERAYLHAVLRVVGGNKSEAARRLGINRRTLQRRLGGDDAMDDVDEDENEDEESDDDVRS